MTYVVNCNRSINRKEGWRGEKSTWLIVYINFLVLEKQEKDAHIKSEDAIYELSVLLLPSCLWKKTLRYKVLLGSRSGNKPWRGIRVDGWDVKATRMEIMAGKFDSSGTTVSLSK